MNKKIKSPLRYPGGKSRVATRLLSLFPEFSEYREPFVGGGSVFFETRQMFPDRKYWINDLYKPLYSLYKVMQTNPDRVVDEVAQAFSSYKDGRLLHDVLKQEINNMSPIGMASAFFILNRITFSGTTESGGYSKQAFEKRFTESSIRRLSEIRCLLNGVKITNTDYQKMLPDEDGHVFVYLDPPYYSAEKSSLYGKNGSLHKNFDHVRFSRVCRKSKHKWLITYDDSDYIRKLFYFGNIIETSVVYGMKNVGKSRQKAREIIITNY